MIAGVKDRGKHTHRITSNTRFFWILILLNRHMLPKAIRLEVPVYHFVLNGTFISYTTMATRNMTGGKVINKWGTTKRRKVSRDIGPTNMTTKRHGAIKTYSLLSGNKYRLQGTMNPIQRNTINDKNIGRLRLEINGRYHHFCNYQIQRARGNGIQVICTLNSLYQILPLILIGLGRLRLQSILRPKGGLRSNNTNFAIGRCSYRFCAIHPFWAYVCCAHVRDGIGEAARGGVVGVRGWRWVCVICSVP